MLHFLNPVFLWFMERRIEQIDFFKKEAIYVQKNILLKLIKQSKETIWGKKHHYSSIHDIKSFQERVPIQDYETLKPYIHQLMKGEENVLWNTPINWFAKSSGTTNDKSKFIPVSKESLEYCHYRGGKDVLAFYVQQNPETKIFKGKSLSLGGSKEINSLNKNSYYGDLSAILIQNLPFWAEFIRIPNSSVALMSEWEKKIELMAKIATEENVTNFSGVPSWNLVLAKKVLEITGKNNLLEVWNNLELFVHGGVNFTPYREQFKKLIPSNKMNYMETYNASEGFFAIQDDLKTDDMLLMLDYGIFYEFIPMKNIEDENPKALTLDEVNLNENYAILISTNGGLWRYMIGDTIIFTSKYPFKIKITGRTKHFINAFGEEIIIDNAEKALKQASLKTNAIIKEYTAGPIFMSDKQKGGHEWLIEFEKAPNNLKEFSTILDKKLKELNSDYEAKRYKNMSLGFPLVKHVRKGIFYQWLKAKGKLGGQNKVPRLANNRKYLDELLKII